MGEPLDADHHWDNARQRCLKMELKVELRAQPKIGRLAHQAAVVLNSAGWTKSSREQAPACYTSGIKPAGVRQMWHCSGTRSSLAQVAGRATHSMTCRQ